MWWKLILRAAVAVGQSEWAKRKAGEVIAKLGKKADAIATVAGAAK